MPGRPAGVHYCSPVIDEAWPATATALATAELPRPDRAAVAVPPPGREPGTWAGAPSAVARNGDIYLAYRLRRPIGAGPRLRGRGGEVRRRRALRDDPDHRQGGDGHRVAGAARAGPHPGRHLAAVPELRDHRHQALARRAARGQRPGRVRARDQPGRAARRQRSAVKDPVIVHQAGQWHLWASVHPLDDPDHTDRMATDYATSPDGMDWTWHGTALAPRPGEWDARGVRVAAVRLTSERVAGLLRRPGHRGGELRGAHRRGRRQRPGRADRRSARAGVAGSDHAGCGLRYLTIVDLGDGRERWYYELTRPTATRARTS